MLEIVRDYFSLSPDVMLKEIQGLLIETEQALLSKGIQYSALKTALVPDPRRREVALVFDTTDIEEGFYGLPIHTRLLPLLFGEGNHSVLVGDYAGQNQERLYEAFDKSVQLARNVTWRHSSQFYVVYVNNLTDNMVHKLRSGLAGFGPYAGFADLTFASPLKVYLSMMLVNYYLQHRDIVIMGHEDDVDNTQDRNMVGLPFDDFGYRITSIQDQMFSTLLSYKIERPVFEGFKADTEFSLNAVNPRPVDLSDFDIQVDGRKFEYLAREKANSLRGIGLGNANAADLRRMILEKVSSNYIYNMEHDENHDTTKFNIVLEVGPPAALAAFRVLAALEYMPDDKLLRVITLY